MPYYPLTKSVQSTSHSSSVFVIEVYKYQAHIFFSLNKSQILRYLQYTWSWNQLK